MNPEAARRLATRALEEDLPDLTTDAIFDPSERGSGRLIAKASGICAGMPFVSLVFETLDPSARTVPATAEGDEFHAGTVLGRVDATVRALLSGERTALNLLQRACGIATTTRRFVEAVRDTGARIYDTRKTAPGLRELDKYAVRAGGGENHRLALHDLFLIKDNHIDRSGGITQAVKKIRASGVQRSLMIEVRTLEELDEAADLAPDFILLDNMGPELLRQAVEQVSARGIELEASGGITLDTVRGVALSGVTRISVGGLTHSVPATDIAFAIE